MKRYTWNQICIFILCFLGSLYIVAMYFTTGPSKQAMRQQNYDELFQNDVGDPRILKGPQEPGYMDKLFNSIDHLLEDDFEPFNMDDEPYVDKMEWGDNVPDIPWYEVDSAAVQDEGSEPVHIDATQILKSTSGDIIYSPKIHYLKDVKAPCFAVNDKMENVGNIDMSDAIKEKYTIKCLPNVFIAGFDGCGTDDLLQRLSKHSRVHTGQEEGQPIKHPHFWDNVIKNYDMTLDDYTRFYQKDVDKIKKQYTEMKKVTSENSNADTMAVIDATPYTISYGGEWRDEAENKDVKQPRLILHQKIQHTIPNSKIILMIKSPTDRLLEDFNKFFKRASGLSAKELDKELQKYVLIAIEWWKHCLEDIRLPLRGCGYGPADPTTDLDPLDYESCLHNETVIAKHKQTDDILCQDMVAWDQNPGDRLRQGIYYVFVKDLMNVFAKKDVLFIRYETYINNPTQTIEKIVLPFLKLPAMSAPEKTAMTQVILPHFDPKDVAFVSNLTRSILDDFYQGPGFFLRKAAGTEELYWTPIFLIIDREKAMRR